ncbi:hypothetical protein EVAR_61276_1 [Eumeta japonica]|uniref:Uncharacterized protein n=1 Tax=Eumeta variegata TaxID=151549 RepID=A0A4C1Z3D8_EUMVA|nr:hypothetical protein EVAR_61276_1 [Eumeta japonica]
MVVTRRASDGSRRAPASARSIVPFTETRTEVSYNSCTLLCDMMSATLGGGTHAAGSSVESANNVVCLNGRVFCRFQRELFCGDLPEKSDKPEPDSRKF